MLQINEKKYNRQVEGIERWRQAKDVYSSSHSNAWGTLWWCTGVGKTFAGCLVINRIIAKNEANTAVIVVPGPTLKKQWWESIKANVTQNYHENVTVYTVDQVMEMINNGQKILCSLFIADELHEYYTDDRLRMFNGINVSCKWMLGLTATYEDIHNRHEKIKHILPVVDRIDEEEATKEGYISKYVEYNIAVDLTEAEKAKYDVLSSLISKHLSKFGHNGLELASKILVGTKEEKGIAIAIKYAHYHGWHESLSSLNPKEKAIIDLWSPSALIASAKLVMDNIRERKNLLYFCANKLRMAKQVVIKFEQLKTICFSQSTNFADILAKVINDYYKNLDQTLPCVVYHSNLQTQIVIDDKGKEKKKGKIKLKREAVEAITTGKARIISTTSVLDKGFDVPDIRLALTTSGTQNPTQYDQRKGRGLRVESYEDDIIVLIINLYVRNTMDEKWLRKRQSKSNNIIYWVDDIDDVTYVAIPNFNNDLIV